MITARSCFVLTLIYLKRHCCEGRHYSTDITVVSPKLGSSPEDTPDEYLVLWVMNDYWDLEKGSVDITAQKCSTRAVLCKAQYLRQIICMLVI